MVRLIISDCLPRRMCERQESTDLDTRIAIIKAFADREIPSRAKMLRKE
jgi:hypothetical protein